MPAIQFFEEDVSYTIKNKLKLRKWIASAIIAEGFILSDLSYIFCTDEYLLQVNQKYLNHDTYTDIITFDNSEGEGLVMGDIFISIDRVWENARKFSTTEEHELHRVMIHGALHLVGYKDKAAADKQKMTLKEDFYLDKRGF